MKICFLDKTSFKYNSKDINSPILRGAETALINISTTLNKLGYEITIINNCPKNEVIDNIRWININNLSQKLTFDISISNNDCNFFDLIDSKKKILFSHSVQKFEKFLRKKQFISYIKHKPKLALLGEYHKSQRSLFSRIFGYFFLDYGVDHQFLNKDLEEFSQIDQNLALFTSRPDRNLDLLINIWKNKIHPNFTSGKLLVTPSEYKINSHNIYFRELSDRKYLINDMLKARLLLLPGHKAELFCLAAEEGRELCLPIITLGIGSLSERVIHGKTGFIAKNNDEFAKYTLELFKDDNLWNHMRNNLKNLRGVKTWLKCSQNLINNF